MIISKIIMKRNTFYYSHSKFSSKSNKLHSVETKGRCRVDKVEVEEVGGQQ